MLKFMNEHYQELKDEVGINEQANLGENDYANDNILTQLKPNTTASNFREFLDIKDNCNKT